MQDFESKQPELNESLAPSPEPSQPNQPFNNPAFGLREIEATWEMIVKSKEAIRYNDHWRGVDVQPIAMLIAMLSNMEGQYHSQLERARVEEKEAIKRVREEIRKAGGQVNGEAIAKESPAV